VTDSAPPHSAESYLIERMRLEDVPQVQVVETQSFSSPWSAQAYAQDIRSNKLAYYVVLRQVAASNDVTAPALPTLPVAQPVPGLRDLWRRLTSQREPQPVVPRPPVLGFAGIWLMVDEAHLVTIAVAPGQRGKGLGELLLVSMLDLATVLRATTMTLEVRVSNHVAQSLYRKYGFKNEGVRRRYYSDNGEDALVMTTDTLTSAYYQAHYQSLKKAILSKLTVSFKQLP
jgi:ribosomal-protein-alanine N-acetyltransferase